MMQQQQQCTEIQYSLFQTVWCSSVLVLVLVRRYLLQNPKILNPLSHSQYEYWAAAANEMKWTCVQTNKQTNIECIHSNFCSMEITSMVMDWSHLFDKHVCTFCRDMTQFNTYAHKNPIESIIHSKNSRAHSTESTPFHTYPIRKSHFPFELYTKRINFALYTHYITSLILCIWICKFYDLKSVNCTNERGNNLW